MHCDGVIIGMNTGFHEAPFVRVRSARLSVVRGKSLTLEVVSYSRVARSRGASIIGEVGGFSKYMVKRPVQAWVRDAIPREFILCGVELGIRLCFWSKTERRWGDYELGTRDGIGCCGRRDGGGRCVWSR